MEFNIFRSSREPVTIISLYDKRRYMNESDWMQFQSVIASNPGIGRIYISKEQSLDPFFIEQLSKHSGHIKDIAISLFENESVNNRKINSITMYSEHETEQLSKNLDFIYNRGFDIKLKEYEESNQEYTFSELVSASRQIDSVVDFINNKKIKDKNGKERPLSMYEKLRLISKYTSSYKYKLENENEDPGLSREIMSVLNSDKICCAGYASMMLEICRRTNVPCFYQIVGNDSGTHAICVVGINDKVYNKKGIYFIDPQAKGSLIYNPQVLFTKNEYFQTYPYQPVDLNIGKITTLGRIAELDDKAKATYMHSKEYKESLFQNQSNFNVDFNKALTEKISSLSKAELEKSKSYFGSKINLNRLYIAVTDLYECKLNQAQDYLFNGKINFDEKQLNFILSEIYCYSGVDSIEQLQKTIQEAFTDIFDGIVNERKLNNDKWDGLIDGLRNKFYVNINNLDDYDFDQASEDEILKIFDETESVKDFEEKFEKDRYYDRQLTKIFDEFREIIYNNKALRDTFKHGQKPTYPPTNYGPYERQ